MGLSVGPTYTDLNGQEFHLEAKDRGVAIWTGNEMVKIIMLDPSQAKALAGDLILHASFVDNEHEQP